MKKNNLYPNIQYRYFYRQEKSRTLLFPYLNCPFPFIIYPQRALLRTKLKYPVQLRCIHLLPREHHQGRIQRDRQEKVANNNGTQRINGHEALNPPLPREYSRPRDHDSSAGKAEKKSPLESLEQSGEFLEKRGVLDLFRCRSPGHVDFEEVTKERL